MRVQTKLLLLFQTLSCIYRLTTEPGHYVILLRYCSEQSDIVRLLHNHSFTFKSLDQTLGANISKLT